MKRGNRKMRWIALLVAVALVLTTSQSSLVAALATEVTAAATELPDAENGVITLTEDVTISAWPSSVTGCETLTIDLQGHTLKYSGGSTLYFTNGQNLTITSSTSGGTLDLSSGLSLTNSYISPESNATVTASNITITSTGSVFYPRGDAAEVNINGCTVTTTGVYCVGTNAATVDNYGVKISISDSTLTAKALDGDDCAVLINVAGTLDITNSTITGTRQAVVVRAGTATIMNSELVKSADVSSVTDRNNGTWASGNEVAQAALVVGNLQQGAYLAQAIATMTNTTVTAPSTTTYPEICVDSNADYSSSLTIAGSSTAVTGEVTKGQYASNAAISITGGTYSASVDSYIASGYAAYSQNGSYVVAPTATGVTVDATDLVIAKGLTASLNATVTPSDTLDTVTYVSNNTSVATVASDGTVTAVKAGETTITVTAGTVSAESDVNVVVYDITATEVSSSSEDLDVGSSISEDTTTLAVLINQLFGGSVDSSLNTVQVDSATETKVRAAVTSGQTLNLETVLSDVDEDDADVADDIETIQAYADSYTLGALQIGQYFDLQVLIKSGSETLGNITQLETEHTYYVDIPESLQVSGRSYGVIRVHDGVAELLTTTVDGNQLSFNTDKFSTYAIAYADSYTLETIADQTYTGSAITPAVVLKNNGTTVSSSEYTVEYTDNTAVGIATVTVKINGEIVATGTFNIVAAATTTDDSSSTTTTTTTTTTTKTGDTNPVLPLAGTCAAALTLIAVLAVVRRRKNA